MDVFLSLSSQPRNLVPPAYFRAGAQTRSTSITASLVKNWRWKNNATLTSAIITGTSTSGPITAANAAPEFMPNTDTATAIASSKLLEAAVNASVVVFE